MKEDVSGLRKDVDLLKEDNVSIRETLLRVAVTQENVVLPRLEALAEGHALLRETLAPKKRVRKLEDDISVLKIAVRAHSDQLAKLEKAQ